MPRGNPGRIITARIDPQLVADVQARTDNLTRAVEEGLRLWPAREERKAKSGPGSPPVRGGRRAGSSGSGVSPAP